MAQIRSSFSQHELFESCPKTWYYKYIRKVPVSQDMAYAHAGSVIHDCLERWYKGDEKDIEALKGFFKTQWDKYNLANGILEDRIDDYWLMVLNGVNLNKTITTTEMKIEFPETVAYLDGVDEVNHEIMDWKSSTRSPENEKSYKKQIQWYAYLYNLKHGVIPTCKVFYLKYNGSKGVMSFDFTAEELREIEQWYWNILTEMGEVIIGKKKVPDWNYEYFWCPYKYLWQQQDKYHFILETFKNYTTVKGPITPLLEKGLKNKFTYELKAAIFIKRQNPYARTSITFYNPRTKVVPVSMRVELIKTLENYAKFQKKEIEIEEVDKREFNQNKVKMPKKFVNGIKLRPHQKIAVDSFLEKKIAIIEAGTGFGKTEVIIESIRKLNMKTLVVVNKIELMNQTIKRIEGSLGIEVGKIGQGKSDIKNITVATIQTLIKNIKDKKMLDYLHSLRFVVFDECHATSSKSYLKVSYQLHNAEYRLGTSATARRQDGNDMAINAVVGYPCYKLSAKELINMDFLEKPDINFITDYLKEDEEKGIVKEYEMEEFKVKDKNYGQEKDLSRELYQLSYNMLIRDNKLRDNVVKTIVDKNGKKKILILVKLVAHGESLSNLLGAFYLHGGTSKADRLKLLDDFTNGDLNVLIGTISIFSEGLDVPKLEILINATANAGDIKSIQVLGRLLRKHKDKKACMYYDFDDHYNSYLKKATMKRNWAFRKEGHKVNKLKYQNI